MLSSYVDIRYDTVLGMLIEVSSYVDVCTRYLYSTLYQQLVLGISTYPSGMIKFACRHIDAHTQYIETLGMIGSWVCSFKYVYRDIRYDMISHMLIEVSSYVDVCNRHQYYSTISRQFILGNMYIPSGMIRLDFLMMLIIRYRYRVFGH
jgi:hypothetical protein